MVKTSGFLGSFPQHNWWLRRAHMLLWLQSLRSLPTRTLPCTFQFPLFLCLLMSMEAKIKSGPMLHFVPIMMCHDVPWYAMICHDVAMGQHLVNMKLAGTCKWRFITRRVFIHSHVRCAVMAHYCKLCVCVCETAFGAPPRSRCQLPWEQRRQVNHWWQWQLTAACCIMNSKLQAAGSLTHRVVS